MAGHDPELKAATTAYRNAKAEANRQEEARWANVIGNILKNRGEYVEALRWLRRDYEISLKYLPEKHLLPTCQSLGEIYLRLERFSDALTYQKKHLELARDANDLVEQQRASTQLGRTYHELFSRSEHDHLSIRNAKKYFKYAMELAQILKEDPPTNKSSFVKEYIDAHNNSGMLEMELDNLEEARKILTRGLEICNEEEVGEDDDGRSRLHHNLGNVYMELRMWEKARKHIEKDIQICNKIEHCQGEAKGYINLGEVHYRTQKYDEAQSYYEKALTLAKSLEDEDALVRQIDENIKTVNKAVKVMDELKKEEQNFKKLKRYLAAARGSAHERKYLLQQNASLDRLLEKSSMISAWEKHCEFAKEKKEIANELCDNEKLSDSYLALGESYQKLRNFNESIKWYRKSWEMYKKIGNLEGQALVKIDIGNVLDSVRNWQGALAAFEESYRIAVEANLPFVQLSALENMHYSNMIRFDDENETRRLKLLIDQLKKSLDTDPEPRDTKEDCCSETDTEADGYLSNSGSESKMATAREDWNDDMPLMSVFQSRKKSSQKAGFMEGLSNSVEEPQQSPRSMPKTTSQKAVGSKRVRVILSDDEEEENVDEMEHLKRKPRDCQLQDFSTTDTIKSKRSGASPAAKIQVVSEYGSKCPINVEDSSSSFKCRHPHSATKAASYSRSLSNDLVAEPDIASGSKCDTSISGKLLHHGAAYPMRRSSERDQDITVKIENDLIYIEATSFVASDQLKSEVACLYYLQLPREKRSEGLLPIIQHIRCAGRDLESLETVENLKECVGDDIVEVSVDGWVQKRLIKMYMDCCEELSEVPNLKVLKKLYNLEVSDDEIIVTECDLQDLSVTPLLNALLSHKRFAMLDLSHNMLGNGTMEKLQKVFVASGQSYGGLTLDLHCNRFGPTALFQICECSVLFARLEVLNFSGNRLTDACGSYLSTILEKCTALCSLNVERCHITSRTIQKMADALDSKSVLVQLCIGYNNPVSGNAIVNLLTKLSTLQRFSELNLSGLKLGKPVVDTLCQLAGTISLSGLMLGSTGIGNEGVMQLTRSLFNGTQELVKLDISYCGLTSSNFFSAGVSSFSSILELKLEGNPIMPEGSNTLSSLLMNPQCCLKVLVLRNCQLGLTGVLHVIEALAENNCLQELNLAGNAAPNELSSLRHDSSIKGCSENLEQKPDTRELSSPMKVDKTKEGLGTLKNANCELEVANNQDDRTRIETGTSGIDDSCASSSQRNSSYPKCHLIRKLSTAIGLANNLQLLDLSDNGFSAEAAELLYGSWSSSSLRTRSSHKHITDEVIHFSTSENKCCRVKPCCKKD
ncbi:LOW QUALITY PROTEIN: protein TONSOKU-like [Neltuma alba]|uniref:LOW QUALITY PROTEIN: protein TONSOKU-like n=1 Tax=Neltuma alba TaxID=207710 RepID=UPI0010A3424A|nr:LOW QUALITY PROTEIN: protein TONSOKU-like [Prosopis alba]